MNNKGLMRIGYLCSEFPALSHTFISREICILEEEGFEIGTASINAARDIEKMGAEDQAYASRTYFIKNTPKPRILAVLLRYIFRFNRFLPALAYSIRLTFLSGPRNLRMNIPDGFRSTSLVLMDRE